MASRHTILQLRREPDDPKAEQYGPCVFWVCRRLEQEESWLRLECFDTQAEADEALARLNGRN